MTGGRPIGDDDLHAFVDDRLPAGRREAVEAYLGSNADAAAKVLAYREQRDALRAHLSHKAGEPIPSRLRVANILAQRRRRAHARLASVAAAFAWLALGSVVGWSANAWLSPPGRSDGNRPLLASDAVSAHRTFVVEAVHPVEVGAAQEQHLVQWLSKRLGRPLRAPDLSAQGFRLMGGRLLPAGGEAAAQFMYDDDQGTRLTLYARAGNTGETAFRFARLGEVSTFYWIDNGFGYVVSATSDRERLLPIAEAIYGQLENAPGRGKTAL
ncbi:MAG: Transmembrane regulator protein PrtR [uncultured Microvirga sp.]|uniref:Transmembrane regulator protein PrtR n=1 Tax=uncultured Microvirga sp. TaxID=412392 RepID=A0A6J4MQJ0_9HYPH|nr:MAG: Transmembrane regulator protein PrtR [uncultured Microvirga sp.]